MLLTLQIKRLFQENNYLSYEKVHVFYNIFK